MIAGCNGDDGHRTLTWNDNSQGEEGFKVYRLVGEKKTLIETTPPDTVKTKVPHIKGACYAVTAFKGSEDTTPTAACDSEKPPRAETRDGR